MARKKTREVCHECDGLGYIEYTWDDDRYGVRPGQPWINSIGMDTAIPMTVGSTFPASTAAIRTAWEKGGTDVAQEPIGPTFARILGLDPAPLHRPRSGQDGMNYCEKCGVRWPCEPALCGSI